MLPWRRALFGGVAIMGGVAPKTYADFQAHIATLAVDGAIGPNAYVASGTRKYRCTLGAAVTNDMFGSSWGDSFGTSIAPASDGSAAGRVILHGLPDAATYNAQVAAGREVYISLDSPGNGDLTGTNRNGYSSLSAVIADGYINSRCLELLYWDGTQVQRMLPFAQSGPTVFPL